MSNSMVKIDLESQIQKVTSTLTYLEWNNKIAEHFFNPNKPGTRVWFSVERGLIEKIAEKNNTNFEDFIKALKQGPDCVTRNQQKVCIKARDTFNDWERRPSEYPYPPYIAYLALFVLAVNHGDSEDFSENDYYGRLRNILNENPSTGQYPSFEKMTELWDNLAKWSSEDKVGQWGEFYHDIYGKHFHVGIPYYQVILTTEDRNNLSEIFWKMGWDSDSSPTEEEILKALKHNKTLLSKRTFNRIERGNSDFLSVLVDRVLEELKEDNEEIGVQEDKESNKRGFIDLCLEINETTEQVSISFRCRRKAGLPEGEFTLTSQNTELKVPFFSSNMSEKIKNLNINWEKDLSAKNGKYSFHYIGQKYKVFTPAKDVSAWISGQRYTPGKLFYLAVHQSLFDKVQKWGKEECNKCQMLEYSGLPRNWHLFKLKGVNKDSIKKDIPALSIDQKPRIRFEGGIRLSRGNKFFSFAPPKITIIGGTEKISKLFCSIDGIEEYKALVSDQDEDFFSLPKDVPYEEWITVSDKQSKEEAQVRIKFFLSENQLEKFSNYSEGLALDYFGGFIKKKQLSNGNLTAENCLQGADGFNMKSNEIYQRFPDVTWDPMEKSYLVGEIPGQIVVWPDEPLPSSWIPIWSIQFKNHKKAIAIWLGDRFSYTKQLQKFSKEKKKLWKDIIWHKRKRITSEINKKWKDFFGRAKHV